MSFPQKHAAFVESEHGVRLQGRGVSVKYGRYGQ